MPYRLFTTILKIYKFYRSLVLRMKSKNSQEQEYKKLIDGDSWESFCETLKTANAALKFPGAPQDAFSQAEGYRYLSRLTRAGLEAFIECADPRFPQLNRLIHETAKLGSDNPDNYYLSAVIDGKYEYKLKGKRNNIHYIGFFTQKGGYGISGDLKPTGTLEGKDLVMNENGEFEIHVAQKAKGENWLAITQESNLLMIRQTFLDRENEIPANIEITCLNTHPDEIRILKPEHVQKGLERTGLFVAGASLFFAKWARDFQKHVNTLPLFDPKKSTAAGGAENITYYHSYWKVGPGDALEIQFTPPECDHWNFQVNNHWMESLDYRHYTIHFNKHTASYESDGSVRIIISHDNPGFSNWINPLGHVQGTMCLRWVGSKTHPEIKTRLVPLLILSKQEKIN